MVKLQLGISLAVALLGMMSVANLKKDPLPWGEFPHDYDTNEEHR